MTSQLRQVYKRIAIFLRSMFTFVRVLPAYGLMRSTKKSNSQTTHIDYKFGKSSLSFDAHEETYRYDFTPIITPFGRLLAKVRYRRECGFDLSGSLLKQPNLNAAVLSDYADHPEYKGKENPQNMWQSSSYSNFNERRQQQQQQQIPPPTPSSQPIKMKPLRLDSPYRTPPDAYRTTNFRPHSLPENVGTGFAAMQQQRYRNQQEAAQWHQRSTAIPHQQQQNQNQQFRVRYQQHQQQQQQQNLPQQFLQQQYSLGYVPQMQQQPRTLAQLSPLSPTHEFGSPLSVAGPLSIPNSGERRQQQQKIEGESSRLTVGQIVGQMQSRSRSNSMTQGQNYVGVFSSSSGLGFNSTPPRHPNIPIAGYSPSPPTSIGSGQHHHIRVGSFDSGGGMMFTPRTHHQRRSGNKMICRTPSDPDLHSLWPVRNTPSGSLTATGRARSGSLDGIKEISGISEEITSAALGVKREIDSSTPATTASGIKKEIVSSISGAVNISTSSSIKIAEAEKGKPLPYVETETETEKSLSTSTVLDQSVGMLVNKCQTAPSLSQTMSKSLITIDEDLAFFDEVDTERLFD
eukprot:g6210.t1